MTLNNSCLQSSTLTLTDRKPIKQLNVFIKHIIQNVLCANVVTSRCNNSLQEEPEAAELQKCCVFTSHRVYHFHRKNYISLSVVTEQNKNKNRLNVNILQLSRWQKSGGNISNDDSKVIKNSFNCLSNYIFLLEKYLLPSMSIICSSKSPFFNQL